MTFKEFYYNLLQEAPIGEIGLIGDWEGEKKRGYDSPSKKLLTNPNYIEKIKTAWNKTPYDFDLYFVNSKEANKYTELGKVNLEFVRNELNIKDLNINPDSITCFFTNNRGVQKVPLTPWIIAHRLAHAMARTYKGERPYLYHSGVSKDLDNFLEEISRDVYGTSLEKNAYTYSGYDYKANNKKELLKKKICEALGTFRSAREGKLRAPFEMVNELISQFIITNKITFNKTLPDFLPLSFAWGKPSSGVRKKKDLNEEHIKEFIENGEEVLYYSIDSLFGGSVGNIYVM